MRNLAACLSEHAVRVSDSSCSGAGNNNISLAILDHSSVQNSVTYLYKTRLSSTAKELFFKLTWSKTKTGPSLSISIDDNSEQVLLREKEGKQSYKHGGSVISMHWDLSSARYTCHAPDPVDNFYVIVMADSEFALLLGDLSRGYAKMFENSRSSGIPTAQFSVVGRKEQVFTHGVYRTKSRFGDNGKVHEITIKCKGDSWDVKNSGLSVWVDKKKVVHEQSLYWNFRGNQVMFVDGLPVDFMWDFFDWWFGGPSGSAVFVFRTRTSLESRLWLEEDELQKEQSFSGFSLLIQAFKSP